MAHPEFDDPHRLASAAVVVGVDTSDGAARALHWAANYAADRGRSLHIIHGLDLVAISRGVGVYAVATPPLVDAVKAAGAALVTRARVAATEYEPHLRITASMSNDNAAQALIEHSDTAFAVVIGATGTAGTLSHLGSTLFAVTSHARGPVIVVRPDPDAGNAVRGSGPVVVGVDGSRVSEAALAAAFAEASERRVGLVAMHAWSDWDTRRFAGENIPAPAADLEAVEEAILAERLAGWREKYPDVEVSREVYLSGPADRLQELSRTAQLVVVGNRGRGGFAGMLLGSTAHALIQHAHCPVMVVHADEAPGTRAVETLSER
ncbi:universal stress protein [Nocardia seriolae]|uniref:Universal stress protein n=1 Tax=Nocardia seriolae TaxID=37332 RepID=A0A0B8N4I5_9NOCA|nr:universal stress protein [Nocardia seriolae]MTJ63797.1 universal stress protein [Nocardia seriolae]MTJ72260.1 universal stress protein [Nocardia seriolae]MTJ88359.1 universal stress protein [Nocardia seriolae]MTK32344.1 universal stress protein [Nocardia seriolae]MTK41685.1 universal stress protein [Nocardia seriolae]